MAVDELEEGHSHARGGGSPDLQLRSSQSQHPRASMEVEEWQVVKGHEGACDWCEQVRCVHVRWAFAQLGNGSRPLLLSAALHQQPHVCVRASIRAATLTHAPSRLSNPGGTQRIYSSSSTTTTTAPRRLVAAVLLAQFLSLCLAVTGISSATLASLAGSSTGISIATDRPPCGGLVTTNR